MADNNLINFERNIKFSFLFQLFGPCNNPHGHGHNYVVEVRSLKITQRIIKEWFIQYDPSFYLCLDFLQSYCFASCFCEMLKEVLHLSVAGRVD